MKLPIQIERNTTDPLIMGQETIRLESHSITVWFPFGGFVWHRPTAVWVGAGHGSRIPIVDVTRLAIWSLGALAMIGGMLYRTPRRRRKLARDD